MYTLGRGREFPPGADSLAGPPAIYQADVRLNRGPSCSIDVGYGYAGIARHPGPGSPDEARQLRGSAAVARALVAGSGIEVREPAESHRFSDWRDRDRWCAASAADSASR